MMGVRYIAVSYTHLDVYKRQVDDDHLPCDVIDIVDEYDDITYLSLTNNIKVDWTKITNVDKVDEIIIRNNPVDYYGIMRNTELTGHYLKIIM